MSTPQNTWDILANEMPESELISMLVNKANAILRYDDAKPGTAEISYLDAVNRAEYELQDEARRWRRKIHISDSIKNKAYVIVLNHY